jgi:hypothetical protein
MKQTQSFRKSHEYEMRGDEAGSEGTHSHCHRTPQFAIYEERSPRAELSSFPHLRRLQSFQSQSPSSPKTELTADEPFFATIQSRSAGCCVFGDGGGGDGSSRRD